MNLVISSKRICRIKLQGYEGFKDEEISQHAVGNRFAYQMCTLLFVTGLVTTNVTILSIAAVVAFLGVVLPYHPFDYLFNYLVRHALKRPKLPYRSVQSKFACGMASVSIAGIILLFSSGLFLWGYVLGGLLFCVAFLVSTIDYCIPSLIYNSLFRRRKKAITGNPEI